MKWEAIAGDKDHEPSLPSRERGLKSESDDILRWNACVAPFAGAWIEIKFQQSYLLWLSVAPFAGAWIEMQVSYQTTPLVLVAPFAGAWIEIPCACTSFFTAEMSLPSRERGLKSCVCWRNVAEAGRSLRGSVD